MRFGGHSTAFGAPEAEFDLPYGHMGQNTGYAMIAQRYAAKYGYDPVAMAKIAVDQRTNALANPNASFFGKPLSIEDVLASKMVAEPLRVLEIVMPVAGGAAVIIASKEVAARAKNRGACITGFGEHLYFKSPTYAAEMTDTQIGPASERALQTAVAEPWFKVSDEGRILEGAIFDRSGNLLFCDVSGRRVLRLTPDRQLSTVVSLDALSPGGLAFHPDGRLFIAALNIPNNRGAIFAVNPDGSGLQAIIPAVAGYMPNDLVFDRKGGFYFTEFKGNATEPKGGVYYTGPDLTTITAASTSNSLPQVATAHVSQIRSASVSPKRFSAS